MQDILPRKSTVRIPRHRRNNACAPIILTIEGQPTHLIRNEELIRILLKIHLMKGIFPKGRNILFLNEKPLHNHPQPIREGRDGQRGDKNVHRDGNHDRLSFSDHQREKEEGDKNAKFLPAGLQPH